jgi:hypothetical protein
MRVSLIYIAIIGATLVAASLIALLAQRIARWQRDKALRQHAAPPLVLPVTGTAGGAAGPVPRRATPREAIPSRPSPASVRRVDAPPVSVDLPDGALDDDDDVIVVPPDGLTSRRARPTHTPSTVAAMAGGTRMFEGSQLRFYRAEEGTLEFLPGRLEVVGGADIGQEIHFAREVGQEGATITFGRSEGPPLRHVQLLDPTVSRDHAKLDYVGGNWHLTNLSNTNPVVFNGTPLPVHGRGITLQDGDRVEMGAVIFVFRLR